MESWALLQERHEVEPGNLPTPIGIFSEPMTETRATTLALGSRASVVLVRVDPFYGRTIVVEPAVDRLPASSIAITVTTLFPGTPYALGVMFVPIAVFSCTPFT